MFVLARCGLNDGSPASEDVVAADDARATWPLYRQRAARGAVAGSSPRAAGGIDAPVDVYLGEGTLDELCIALLSYVY